MAARRGSDRAQLIDRPVREPRLAEQLSARGLQDAMIAPLRGEDGVIGTLLVGNRVGETFRTDDLPLFETLANHASVLPANGRLMDRLREEAAEKEYQALHDSLTGLPNRTLFHDRVEHRLASLEQHGLLAILLADLDRFKEVNDTLGHHNGDLLLKEVAWRLRKVLDSDVTVRSVSAGMNSQFCFQASTWLRMLPLLRNMSWSLFRNPSSSRTSRSMSTRISG